MALGGLFKKASLGGSSDAAAPDEKREAHRDPALETGVYGYDEEKTGERGRKMSRIGGPQAIGLTDSDAESTMSVGKQVEKEQQNSIKYRTCSWQKVN